MLLLCELDVMRDEFFPLALLFTDFAWTSEQSDVRVRNFFIS